MCQIFLFLCLLFIPGRRKIVYLYISSQLVLLKVTYMILNYAPGIFFLLLVVDYTKFKRSGFFFQSINYFLRTYYSTRTIHSCLKLLKYHSNTYSTSWHIKCSDIVLSVVPDVVCSSKWMSLLATVFSTLPELGGFCIILSTQMIASVHSLHHASHLTPE